MRRHDLWLVCVVLGCESHAASPSTVESTPPRAVIEEARPVSAASGVRLVRTDLAADGEARPQYAVLDPGEPMPSGWTLVADFDDPVIAAKVSWPRVLRALTRTDTVHAFLKLDLAAAPTDPKTALREAGFAAGTVSGDVVTGQLPVEHLAPVLALPWVTHLELAKGVRARADNPGRDP